MLIVGMCAPGRALTISARPTMAGASRRSGLIGRAALDSTRMSTEGRLRGLDLLRRASTPLIPHPNTSCYTCLRTRDPPVRRYKSRRSLISHLLQAPPWVGGACVETRDWTCVPNCNLSKKLSRVHESHNWHSRTHDNKGGDSAPDNGCNSDHWADETEIRSEVG